MPAVPIWLIVEVIVGCESLEFTKSASVRAVTDLGWLQTLFIETNSKNL